MSLQKRRERKHLKHLAAACSALPPALEELMGAPTVTLNAEDFPRVIFQTAHGHELSVETYSNEAFYFTEEKPAVCHPCSNFTDLPVSIVFTLFPRESRETYYSHNGAEQLETYWARRGVEPLTALLLSREFHHYLEETCQKLSLVPRIRRKEKEWQRTLKAPHQGGSACSSCASLR